MGDPIFVMNIELVCVRKITGAKVSRVPNNGLKKLKVCFCPQFLYSKGTVCKLPPVGLVKQCINTTNVSL